jgi:DNA replication protein DnaC
VPVARLTRWNRFDDDAMATLERASALVVDDMGAEYMDDKGAFRSFVDGLMNARYADGLATVLTTNLNGQTFADRYGTRFADRLREAGRFVELRGTSMRGRQGA